jgi:hypothetical protein
VSLRLAEAFTRAAAPEGHEPLRNLEDLRGHMYGAHNWDVAYILPLRTLLRLHEKEHGDHEQEWHGSPDASRSSGFTARRKMAGTWDEGGHWDRAMDSLAEHGFHDSQMTLDSGHNMWVYHQGAGGGGGVSSDPGPLRDVPGFHVSVWHPTRNADPSANNLDHTVEGYLGTAPDHVGPRLRAMFGRRDVLSHLRDQMSGRTTGPLHVDMTQER